MGVKKDIPSFVFIGCMLALIAVTFALKVEGENRNAMLEERLWQRPDGKLPVCVLQMRRQDDSTAALLSGYNYHLLELFSKHVGTDFDIRLAGRNEDYTDSLRFGAVDILIRPFPADSIPLNCISTRNIDSTSIWILREGDSRRAKDADKWIDEYHASGKNLDLKHRFFNVYDPVHSPGALRCHLSPYDDIIREYADSIGWDWRLLAAVIYQESRFKIEVVSHRGATGLMQLRQDSSTETDLVNPRKNIRAGALLLKNLMKRYQGVAPDVDERHKLALAAYNAGTGRMKDILNYAAFKGVDRSCWDSLEAIIPQMRDSVNIAESDTVKLGTFKGVETIAYVRNVMKHYGTFKTIIPE